MSLDILATCAKLSLVTAIYRPEGEHMSYNGWKNYETWAVKLWLDNDEGTYNYMRTRAGEVLEEHTDEGTVDDSGFRIAFADFLKEYHDEQLEEIMPENSGVFTDLLRGALSDVDWFEIADAYLSDAKEAAE